LEDVGDVHDRGGAGGSCLEGDVNQKKAGGFYRGIIASVRVADEVVDLEVFGVGTRFLYCPPHTPATNFSAQTPRLEGIGRMAKNGRKTTTSKKIIKQPPNKMPKKNLAASL
jgi:hypothetical protein